MQGMINTLITIYDQVKCYYNNLINNYFKFKARNQYDNKYDEKSSKSVFSKKRHINIC